jgi:hypothetical protein
VPSRPLLLAMLFLAACSGKDKPAPAPIAAADSVSTPQAEAEVLGRELYSLVDQAMSYKSAHRGRLPSSLRELGVDQLTRSTSRTLTASGGEPTVQVEFRNLGVHELRNCRATSSILEEASLSGGEFSVICTTVAGGSTTLKVRP